MTEPMVETMQYVNSDESKSDSQTKDIDMNPTTTPSDSLADWTELCSHHNINSDDEVDEPDKSDADCHSDSNELKDWCFEYGLPAEMIWRLENMLNKDNIDSVISIDTAHTAIDQDNVQRGVLAAKELISTRQTHPYIAILLKPVTRYITIGPPRFEKVLTENIIYVKHPMAGWRTSESVYLE